MPTGSDLSHNSGSLLHPPSGFNQSVGESATSYLRHFVLNVDRRRMQTLAKDASSLARKPSTLFVLRSAVVEQGVRSLYTGLTASLMRQMTYSLVRLGSYDTIKASLADGGRPTTGQILLASGIAGGLGGIAGNPAGSYLRVFVRTQFSPTRLQI